MQLEHQIADFLAGQPFAVVGVSSDRRKYGNKVLRCFKQHSLDVVPVNPNASVVEGLIAVTALADCVTLPHAISIITPPKVTEDIVRQAIELGIQHIWMQPGAESSTAGQLCRNAGCNVIFGGPCVLVVLGYRESAERSITVVLSARK